MVLLDSFLRWWLRSGRYGWSRIRRAIFEQKYKNMALPTVNSLEEIERHLKKITWTMDGPLHAYDAISYPQTVWIKKQDDCDGFSILAAALLRQWRAGCRPVLITAMLHPVKRSHTVCGFLKEDGKLCYFDNSYLRDGNYDTYADIAAEVKRNATMVCWDVRDPETFKLIEFNIM